MNISTVIVLKSRKAFYKTQVILPQIEHLSIHSHTYTKCIATHAKTKKQQKNPSSQAYNISYDDGTNGLMQHNA